MTPEEVNRAFGNIDLFLLDQLLKGNFRNRKKLLDAGCGEGRNLKYFTSGGYEVYGIDNSASAIRMASMVYRNKATFIESALEEQPFPENSFEAIICINVLHHARDGNHYMEMLRTLVKMLLPGGIFFIRTLIKNNASAEKDLFEVPEEDLKKMVAELNLRWMEPLKKEVMDDGKALGVVALTKDN